MSGLASSPAQSDFQILGRFLRILPETLHEAVGWCPCPGVRFEGLEPAAELGIFDASPSLNSSSVELCERPACFDLGVVREEAVQAGRVVTEIAAQSEVFGFRLAILWVPRRYPLICELHADLIGTCEARNLDVCTGRANTRRLIQDDGKQHSRPAATCTCSKAAPRESDNKEKQLDQVVKQRKAFDEVYRG